MLYSDESSIYVFDGKTGDKVIRIGSSSATAFEYPIVVDADHDGHAEFVTIRSRYGRHTDADEGNGVRVYEDANRLWVPARSIWNQHSYSIDNINDDMTVPRQPVPSWLTHNTFRLNKRTDAPVGAVADLTVGYLRVADAGTGGTSTLTVRVGNGGSDKAPAGLTLAIYSTDPALGTPTASARLATASIGQALQPGDYRDISISFAGGLDGLGAGGRIWIVGDDNGQGQAGAADFDRTNNTIAGDLSAVAVNLQPAVGTDKPVYTEAEQAVFTAVVANAGSFVRQAQVQFAVLDGAGQVVAVLPPGAPVDVPPGASASTAALWPAAGVLSGNYQVRAQLVTAQGVVYASATASFAVQASQAQTNGAGLSLDRLSYDAAQTVRATARVSNLSANTVQDNLNAQTVITDSAGAAVFSRTEAIGQLAPGAQRQYSYSLAAAGLAPGSYRASLRLLDTAGLLLAQSAASFSVGGSDQSGIGLAGQLQASPGVVLVGQAVAVSVAATYSGNAALANVPVTMRVLDPATGAVLASFSQTVAGWLPGATQTFQATWLAQGLDGQGVVAAASAQVGGRDIPLGQATIRLVGVPLLQAQPAQLVFDPLAPGQSAPAQSLVLSSVGSATATSVTLALVGADATQFVLPAAGCTPLAALPVGITCTLTVSYRPDAAGQHQAQLRVGYAGGADLLVDLSGQARTNTPTQTVSLNGTLAADPSEVTTGQTVSLGYLLSNPDSSAVTAQASLAVQNSAGQTLASWPLQVVLPAAGSYAGSQPYVAVGSPQTLTAVLSQTTGTASLVLASTSFAIVAAQEPVPVQLGAALQRDSRVLVLVSCPASQGSADHDDDDDEERERKADSCTPQPDVHSCTSERVQGIASYLEGLGIASKVVTSEAAFRHQMRCGGYNTYWISGPAAKLDSALVREVREAVWRGDALIMDGEHDSRNQLLDPVAGVKFRGTLPVAGLSVTTSGTSTFGTSTLATQGRPARYDLVGGRAEGRFAGGYSAYPAIISHRYGAGASMLFAFDLAAMVTPPDATQNTVLGQILQATASQTAGGTGTLAVGDVAAVAITLTNPAAVPASVQLIASLPPGIAHADASPQPTAVGTGTVSWLASVPAGQSLQLLWRVRTSQAGTISLPLAVYSVPQGPVAQLLHSQVLSLNVAADAAQLQAALPAVQALAPTRASERSSKNAAIAAINNALALNAQGRYTDAIAQWTAAANALIGITSADTSAARTAVARALRASTGALCQQMACISGELTLGSAQPAISSVLGLTRAAKNSCAAPLGSIAIAAQLTNRRSGQTVLQLGDTLTLPAHQTSTRQASWTVQGQAGDWMDGLLTASWQGHLIELDAANAQLAASQSVCVNGQPLAASRFSPNGSAEGLFAKGGKPGSSDWEWALGQATGQSGRYTTGQRTWQSGKTYQWQLSISAAGQGVYTVKDGSQVVASGIYLGIGSARMKLGNAIRLSVKSAGDVGAARIAAMLTRLQGQSVAASVATEGANQERAVVLYQSSMASGLNAEGTVTLTYSGSAPPEGARLQMGVQAGSAQCL